jgi:hypothetical protein
MFENPSFSRRNFLKVGGAGTALLGASFVTGFAGSGARAIASPASQQMAGGSRSPLADAFVQLTRRTQWQQVAVVPVQFRTYHPQGMARVKDRFFVSSVETIVRPVLYEQPIDGYDRSPGEGVGHLFEIGQNGELLRQTKLGEGTIYHPGGIDYDGKYVWVPVAEYRPDSHSIIYRVNPNTLEATEVFRFPDHIGGIVHNTTAGTLHGVSWGSRRLYRWTLNNSLDVTDADRPPEELYTLNKEHYIDYQDCQYVGANMALCSGLVVYNTPKDPSFYFGGIDLVDLETDTPAWQIPVTLWTESGLVMTHNPVFVEKRSGALRYYFMPEDDNSRLFVYDAVV